jgi:hypothetical protein
MINHWVPRLGDDNETLRSTCQELFYSWSRKDDSNGYRHDFKRSTHGPRMSANGSGNGLSDEGYEIGRMMISSSSIGYQQEFSNGCRKVGSDLAIHVSGSLDVTSTNRNPMSVINDRLQVSNGVIKLSSPANFNVSSSNGSRVMQVVSTIGVQRYALFNRILAKAFISCLPFMAPV